LLNKCSAGVWRFEIIRTALILEYFNVLKYLPATKHLPITNLFYCYAYKDVYEDAKRPGRTFIDVRLKVENDD